MGTIWFMYSHSVVYEQTTTSLPRESEEKDLLFLYCILNTVMERNGTEE